MNYFPVSLMLFLLLTVSSWKFVSSEHSRTAEAKKSKEGELELDIHFSNLDELRKALEENSEIRNYFAKYVKEASENGHEMEIQVDVEKVSSCESESTDEPIHTTQEETHDNTASETTEWATQLPRTTPLETNQLSTKRSDTTTLLTTESSTKLPDTTIQPTTNTVKTTPDPCQGREGEINSTNESCPVTYDEKCYTLILLDERNYENLDDAKKECIASKKNPANIYNYCHFKIMTEYLGKQAPGKDVWIGMSANTTTKTIYLSNGTEVELPNGTINWQENQENELNGCKLRGNEDGISYIFNAASYLLSSGVFCEEN